MKRTNLIISVGIAAGCLLFGAKAALATDLVCDGSDAPGHCDITTLHNLGAGGTFTTPAGSPILHIKGAGELRVNGGATLNLNVAGGAPAGLIIELGGKITGNATGTTGVGATLNINVAAGDVILAASGATISAQNTAGGGCGSGHGGVINLIALGTNANIVTEDGTTITVNGDTCSAGAVNISAPNGGAIDIDGDVLSQSLKTGSGTANSNANPPVGGTQAPGGGPIFITAACNLTISDTGFVSSHGKDPGADLVHLQGGCDVLIEGLVESTGTGHVPPGNPPNSCSNVIPHAGSTRRNPATRPGKPFNSTACVEVWAGNSLIIIKDSAGNNGEINADTGASPGGSSGTSWIDLFARGDIRVLNSTATFAVHANGNAGTDDGGVITVKSAGTGPAASPGNVILKGLALQASAAAAGIGGTVDVEALLDIDLSGGELEARANGSASTGNGGHIIVHSFKEDILSDLLSVLDVTGHVPANGLVDLTACKTIGFPPGTILPLILPAANITKSPGTCGVGPAFPSAAAGQYDVVLPDCTCGGGTPKEGGCQKSTVNSVLNTVTGRFPGNAGPDLTFRLDLGHDQDGNTSIQQSITNVIDHNGDGYLIVMVQKDDTGQLGGSTVQAVDIRLNYPMTFALFGCSVTLIDPAKGDGFPAGHIEAGANSPDHFAPFAPGNIFVMDLHGNGSEIAGWLVEGNGRYLRNVATSQNAVGIAFVGNGNTMHNGNGINNTGAGIYVQGNGNTVDSSDVFGNGGNGVTVVGGSNKVLKVDAGDRGKGNGGDGVNVSNAGVAGPGNTIQEVDAYANGGNGIAVAGNGNKLLKNNAGDAKKGNSLDGILLSGNTNTVQENDAYANGRNGIEATGDSNSFSKNVAGDRGDKANKLDGFLLAKAPLGAGGSSLSENSAVGNLGNGFHFKTDGFSLLKNIGGGSGSGQPNALCQFEFDVAGNTNSGQNKANNVTIVGLLTALLCK
jgi:hypothetical protein